MESIVIILGMMNILFNLKLVLERGADTQLVVSSRFNISEKMSEIYMALSNASKETLR